LQNESIPILQSLMLECAPEEINADVHTKNLNPALVARRAKAED
jgi:hypothetical protein